MTKYVVLALFAWRGPIIILFLWKLLVIISLRILFDQLLALVLDVSNTFLCSWLIFHSCASYSSMYCIIKFYFVNFFSAWWLEDVTFNLFLLFLYHYFFFDISCADNKQTKTKIVLELKISCHDSMKQRKLFALK